MALFGKKNEEIQEVEMDIRTNNSWFSQGVPKYIIRHSIYNRDKSFKSIEKMSNKGQDYINPVIPIANCIKIVETEQTLEITTKNGLKIIPKSQIIEIRY